MDWSARILRMMLACLLIISISTAYAALPCQQREVSSGHLVCVCNATYCDTLDADTDVPSGEYVLFSTTKAGQRFAKSTGSLTGDNARAATLKFSVDPSSTHQTIIGFGGAFTDAAGINLLTLSAPAQEKLLKSYYSPEGIEFNMGRVPIAGSDFSTHPYSYDDVEGDDDLSEFDLTSEDLTYKIPIIQKAKEMSRKEIKLLAAAWSPPTWMKTNNAITGFSRLKEQYYQLWADYHLKFLDAYKSYSLDFWAISTGNEPFNGVIPLVNFNSLGWTPKTQGKWLAENLGPTIKNSGSNQTKILALDDQRFMLPWWINKMVETNKDAEKYIDGVAVHWYWDDFLPANLLTATHNNFPDKFILATEACKGERPWDYPKVDLGGWSRAEAYAVLGIIGALLMGSTKLANSYEMLFLGRLIIGVNCGLNTSLVPMYISEIAPLNLRGGLGTVNQLAVTVGLLLSQVLGIEQILGTDEGWPILLGLALCPAVLQLFLLPLCPESPRYLLITKQWEEQARQALRRLRASNQVEEDIEEMKAEERAQQAEATISMMELICSPTLRSPLIIGVVMQLSQQLSGINAVFYYSTNLFVNSGLSEEHAKFATIGIGSIMVVMTLVSIFLMDRMGRRTLHLWGLGGMFIFSIFITISFLIKEMIDWMSYWSVVSTLSFVVFFAVGPGSIPWMITAELFSQGPRPAAMSIAVLVNWMANFLVGIGFPSMHAMLENYTFLPFSLFLAIFWVFTYKKVPETKNKTFEEILALFRHGNGRCPK